LAANQKKARRLGATLVFLDETGFLSCPYVGTTWAPIGQTPVLRFRLRHRKKVTVLGSLTISPARRRCGLYAEFLPNRSVKEQDLILHLRRLRRSVRTPLVVVLDNLNQHKGRALRNWCRRIGDVHLDYLPPYAPELNPAEYVWNHGKCVTAAGRVTESAEQLEALACHAIATASRQRLLRGFVRATRLPIQFDLKLRKHQYDP
jgi:hypothetical protein